MVSHIGGDLDGIERGNAAVEHPTIFSFLFLHAGVSSMNRNQSAKQVVHRSSSWGGALCYVDIMAVHLCEVIILNRDEIDG